MLHTIEYFKLVHGRRAGAEKVTRYFKVRKNSILQLDVTRMRISSITHVTYKSIYANKSEQVDLHRIPKQEFYEQLDKLKQYLGI